jgi:hypothetical protein
VPQEGTPAQVKAETNSEETKQFARRVRRVIHYGKRLLKK